MKVMLLLIFAAVVMLLTVLLGLHLKNKIDEAPDSAEAFEVTDISDDEIPAYSGDYGIQAYAAADSFNVSSTKNQISTKKITGDYLDIMSLAEMSRSEIKDIIDEIDMYGYSAVSVNLTDESGTLLYSSDAAASVARTKSADQEEKNLPDVETLAEIVEAAESIGLSTSAVITNTFSALKYSSDADDLIAYEASLFFDCALIKELEEIGFDEVILRGYTFSSYDMEQLALEISAVNDYIKALKASSPDILIGIALPSSVYRNVKFTPSIEVLSQKADILAIDISAEIDPEADSEEIFNEVSDICASIPGSFSLYNIRAVLSGASLQVRTAQLDALLVNSVSNWQFISGPVS